MRNQHGEATLFCVLILVALSGLLTLCSLELELSFRTLQKRTRLFLCVKELKGEMDQHLTYMGRLNWVIRNTARAQLAAVFIPPLWPVVGNADKIKKVAKGLQAMSLAPYFLKMKKLKAQGCPVDPRLLLTPFELGNDFGYRRTPEGTAKLRSETWTSYFLLKPYLLTLKVNATNLESLKPRIGYQAEEKLGTLSSLLSSR